MYHHHHHNCPNRNKELWVVTVVSNPIRWRSRYDRFRLFKEAMDAAGVNLFVVELALGDRPFEITEACNPNHLQLRSLEELWQKETMINLAIERLPAGWKYVAWLDADVEFMRHDWPEEIIEQLQHYKVIQLFKNMIDLGPDGEVFQTHEGFVSSWLGGKPLPGFAWRDGKQIRTGYNSFPNWHPGYAWAATREAINALGGLMDFAILGSADHHMAWALLGKVFEYAPDTMSAGYRRALEVWQDRALKHVKMDIGFMPGTMFHHWHGRKKDRRYVERWDVLLKHGYDPDFDIKDDWQGLKQLSALGERMNNDIRRYFRQRSEDSVEL